MAAMKGRFGLDIRAPGNGALRVGLRALMIRDSALDRPCKRAEKRFMNR
jgi:hypothetical protein